MKKGNNKAGCTANTSCGRVCRSGNAHFRIFELDHLYGRTDGRTKPLIESLVRDWKESHYEGWHAELVTKIAEIAIVNTNWQSGPELNIQKEISLQQYEMKYLPRTNINLIKVRVKLNHFHSLKRNEPMEEWTDRRTDDGWTDGQLYVDLHWHTQRQYI